MFKPRLYFRVMTVYNVLFTKNMKWQIICCITMNSGHQNFSSTVYIKSDLIQVRSCTSLAHRNYLIFQFSMLLYYKPFFGGNIYPSLAYTFFSLVNMYFQRISGQTLACKLCRNQYKNSYFNWQFIKKGILVNFRPELQFTDQKYDWESCWKKIFAIATLSFNLTSAWGSSYINIIKIVLCV